MIRALVAMLTISFAAQAVGATEDAHTTATLRVTVGHSLMWSAHGSIRRIAVADPATVEVLPIEGRSLYVLGKKIGSTNLLIWAADEDLPRSLTLQVDRDVTSLREALRSLLPNERGVEVSASGDHLVLSGTLNDALSLGSVLDLAKAHAGEAKIANLLTNAPAPQVLLEVKVAEVSKTLIDRLGARVNLVSDGTRSITLLGEFLSGSGGRVDSVKGSDQLSVDLEERRGLIKILAEPSILAMSGEQGEFLAGGKVFIPVTQIGAVGSGSSWVSLEEREFGVGLKFLPTVLPRDRIRLKVSAEVSEISTTGTTVSSSSAAPAVLPTITSRKTATTVQLEDGQSFAVGGLTKDNIKGASAGIPWLSDIPLLGALFRSSDFQNDRSELIFMVTARLVREPTPTPLPTDAMRGTTRGERVVTGELSVPLE